MELLEKVMNQRNKSKNFFIGGTFNPTNQKNGHYVHHFEEKKKEIERLFNLDALVKS